MKEKKIKRKRDLFNIIMVKKNSGITLIALIITVIVLLILAGVAISTVIGNGGLLSKSKTSVEVYSKEQAKEKLQMYLYDIKMDIIATRDTTVKDCLLLKEKEGIEKIEFISKGTASATIVGGEITDPEYAMVTCFSFTFKVNGKLMIVSEVKTGDNEKEGNLSETDLNNNEETSYTITYELNGGTLTGEKNSYTEEDNDYTLPTPKKNGYVFQGWNEEGSAEIIAIAKILKGSTGNKKYIANWVVSDSQTFSFYKGVQTFTVPGTGEYTLEVWGAQGGTSSGGQGGYATGTVTLTAGQTLYIVTGEQGKSESRPNITCPGGYNGGRIRR